MTDCIIKSDRRRDPRQAADDIIRWKRPGTIEDNKAWMVDRSTSGVGFLTIANTPPQVGETINLRRLDGHHWATIDQVIRVARVAPTASDELIMIGCQIEPAATI